jgi:DNA-binding response OmpR family regulator
MNKRILFLEDDQDLLASYEKLFGLLFNCSTVSAMSVDELRVNAATALSCDLAFLDINLGYGVESGIDGFHWLRNNGFKGQIIFLTGHARSHPLVQHACTVSGALVFQKPLHMSKARELIEGSNRAKAELPV